MTSVFKILCWSATNSVKLAIKNTGCSTLIQNAISTDAFAARVRYTNASASCMKRQNCQYATTTIKSFDACFSINFCNTKRFTTDPTVNVTQDTCSLKHILFYT